MTSMLVRLFGRAGGAGGEGGRRICAGAGAGAGAGAWVGVLAVAITATVAGALACGPSKPPVEPEPDEPVATAEPPPSAPAPPAPSLYERLGKRAALEGVVDDLLANALADNRISKFFDKVKKDKERAKQLRTRLVAELCVVAGGAATDCAYDGKSMKDAHKGMGIGEAQWNAFIEDLTIALKTHGVDDALSKELLDDLDKQTKADIVAPAAAATPSTKGAR